MCEVLKYNKRLDEKKIYLWPNWIRKSDYVLDETAKGKFRRSNGIDATNKIIGYAGNVGLKQGLETLIDLADALREDAQLKFFIIGEGTALKTLMEYANSKSLKNLFFLPFLSPEDYKSFLNDLDIFFLPQKKTEFDVYFPSKLLSLMTTKKTILLSADKDSELYKTIKGHNTGFVTEFGDIRVIQTLVYEILISSEKREEVSINAINYVSQFERDIVLDRILKKMEEL